MTDRNELPASGHSRLDMTSLTGLEFVQGLADGHYPRPPMAELLPFVLLPPREGTVELRASPEPRFLNTLGTVHGGWSMTMLDTCMALAAHTTLAPGELSPTLDTAVKFVHPISGDSKELRLIGHVISRSRNVITLEGRIETIQGKLHAHGTSTCMIVRRER
ncbi:PaaI family thioesterase [Pannonibacter phragmitetus]|uniref:PaaI family thioesterase n=1 Tax=Pannonibacter phragmitetus TaxID=121719 RepID=UPI000F4479BC|nr:PaaI family thioesterase [Pannonibacter phragmitetus]MBA4204955.1 PaaI family thioesterase [Polymorphum sp.]